MSPVNTNQIDTMNQVYNAIHEVNRAMFRIWKEDSLFTWEWWLGVGLVIIPWVVWVILRKKDSTDRLLHAGFFVIIISAWLDFFGVSLGLWVYKYSIIPSIPTYIPWDFCLIPVTMLLLLQYKPNLNPLIKAIFIAGMTAFVGEPIFKWIGLYDPRGWKYIYSALVYGGIYLAAHYISRRKKFADLDS